ncbi:type 4 pilus major pilin [Shigella flexneri]
MKKMRNKKGYSLVELVIVISMILIISSLIIITYNVYRQGADTKRFIQEINIIMDGAENILANTNPNGSSKTSNVISMDTLKNSYALPARIRDGNYFSPFSGTYTLGYDATYPNANVVQLTITKVPEYACEGVVSSLATKYFEIRVNNSYVPLLPPASGTTWNRNTLNVTKAVTLCTAGSNNTIILSNFLYPKTYMLYTPGGEVTSAQRDQQVNDNYNLYKNTMTTREAHQAAAQ